MVIDYRHHFHRSNSSISFDIGRSDHCSDTRWIGISNMLAGFLTTIPLLAFALISPFAPKLSKRYGMELTLFLSLCLLTVGILMRSAGSILFLVTGTFLIGVAIAFGNVLIASLNKVKLSITYWSYDRNLLGCYEYFSNDRLWN